MNEQLYSALIVFGTSTLGGLGTLIAALFIWLSKKLDTNTTITTQARDASNGRLAETLDRLAVERNLVVALRVMIRDRDDQLAYITTRLPDAERLRREYADRNVQHITPADERATERRALGA